MTVFYTVLITLAVVVGLVALALWILWPDIRKRDAEIEAWHRAWQVQQVQYDAEQRMREATRTAMHQMLAEVRKVERDG